jgi:hypothetical protein
MASASRDIRYWSERRATAVVAPEPADDSIVRFGLIVTIVREDNREQTFRICRIIRHRQGLRASTTSGIGAESDDGPSHGKLAIAGIAPLGSIRILVR